MLAFPKSSAFSHTFVYLQNRDAPKKQALEDDRIRNAIEGKFGEGKRRFGLNRIMAKLDNTSQTTIAITFLVMNLCTWWRRFFMYFYVERLKQCLFWDLT